MSDDLRAHVFTVPFPLSVEIIKLLPTIAGEWGLLAQFQREELVAGSGESNAATSGRVIVRIVKVPMDSADEIYATVEMARAKLRAAQERKTARKLKTIPIHQPATAQGAVPPPATPPSPPEPASP